MSCRCCQTSFTSSNCFWHSPGTKQKLICHLTIRSKGSCVLAALSSSSLYSSSSHNLCRVLSGSLSCTGIATLERSLPMLFLRMFHKLMVLLLGLGEGRRDLRRQITLLSSTEPGDMRSGKTLTTFCAMKKLNKTDKQKTKQNNFILYIISS